MPAFNTLNADMHDERYNTGKEIAVYMQTLLLC